MRFTSVRLATVLVAVALAANGGAASAFAGASPARRTIEGRATIPHAAHVTGQLPAQTPLQVAVTLRPRDAAALTAYATGVSTPGGALYGRFLTVRGFAARFGASGQAVRAVEAALRDAGLRIVGVPADHLSVDVSGTAAAIERAFTTDLARVQIDGRSAYANRTPVTAPAAIARYVEGVLGLNDLATPQPEERFPRHSLRPGVVSTVRPSASGLGNCEAADATVTAHPGYVANAIGSIYGLSAFYGSGDAGAGQTVAVLEYEPYQATDITTYETCYGLPARVPTTINVDGGPGAYNRLTGDDGEAALDIEQIAGLAPAATIDVYQAPPAALGTDMVLGAIVSADRAKVISTSWGACEQAYSLKTLQEEDLLLEEAAIQGQSFFAASGDSGSTSCLQITEGSGEPDDNLSVTDPAAQPFATGVGGTTLADCTQFAATCSTPQTGSYPGEYVWNDGGGNQGHASGTGGGHSALWPMPSYQSSATSVGVIQSDSSSACEGKLCREVPDVSADGDPETGYAVYVNGGASGGGWTVIGGTSAAAPLWASMTALFDASPTCRGLPVGFENPALYFLADNGSVYASSFHDIPASGASPETGLADNDTFGGNNADNSLGLYPVLNGYDMATGLGTPVANTLGAYLCRLRAPVYQVSIANPGTRKGTVGKRFSLRVRATDSGHATLSFTASGLPKGLTISARTGEISGVPRRAGHFKVTVTATDGFKNTGRRQFTLTVRKR